MLTYGIVGAGGFGREVEPIVSQMLTDSDSALTSEVVFVAEGVNERSVNGRRCLNVDEFLGLPGSKFFNVAFSDSTNRMRLSRALKAAGATPFTIHAANSVQMEHSSIGEGAILCPFTTVTVNATIGRFFHLNIYSYVAHDCIVGDFVTFAPNVCCNGRVTIEDHVYVGTGAVIRPGDARNLRIGEGAVVGMGAVVTRDVEPYTTVVGNPARPHARRS
jgi:sugar O-acyltransferase (sialic acid O-acetyltransferase NeuD family)